MGFFSRPGSIGVELDAGTIRVVEMRGTPEQPQLVKWGTHPLPEGAMVEGMVVQPLSVSTALIELWSRLELKKRQVVLGVANQGVLVRYTTFPKPPDNKVAQMVRLQAPEYLPYLAGLMAIIGHDFSVFLKFTGGKGVATTVGVVLRLLPLICLLALVIWVLMVAFTRYVSLGSIIAALSLPVFSLVLAEETYVIVFMLLMGLLIVLKHQANIGRLIRRKENKLSRGEK